MNDDFAIGDLASSDPDQLARERAIRFRAASDNMAIQPPGYQVGEPQGVPPDFAMGSLAAQDAYRPLGNDPWTGLMRGQTDLPLSGAPEPPSPVVFKTASPLVNITQKDLDTATDLALSFSGGGLSTKPTAPGGILAYHGSPHDFERFDLSKIGTGEGAQAYGHGLYFAEAEPTARFYRESLGGKEFTVNDKVVGKYGEIGQDPVGNAAARLLQQMGNEGVATAENIAAAKVRLLEVNKNNPGIYRPGQIPEIFSAMDNLEGQRLAHKFPGKMYEVNINADPAHFLDWDKPLSGQSEHVRAVYQNLKGGIDPAEAAAKVRSLQERMTELASDRDPVTNVMRNEQQWHRLARERDAAWEDWNTAQSGAKFYGSMGRKAPIASDVIREAGIPGIRYLDQGSRNLAMLKAEPHEFLNGEMGWKVNGPRGDQLFDTKDEANAFIKAQGAGGSSNYVVFNDKLIDILRKYGLAGFAPAGMGALAAQDQYNNR